jgi:hypothetical protein
MQNGKPTGKLWCTRVRQTCDYVTLVWKLPTERWCPIL